MPLSMRDMTRRSRIPRCRCLPLTSCLMVDACAAALSTCNGVAFASGRCIALRTLRIASMALAASDIAMISLSVVDGATRFCWEHPAAMRPPAYSSAHPVVLSPPRVRSSCAVVVLIGRCASSPVMRLPPPQSASLYATRPGPPAR